MSELEPTRDAPPPPVHSIERVSDAVPDGVALLVLTGELDISTGPDLRRHLDTAASERAERVVLDLADVAFMDSSMLKELLRANAELREQGSRLVLAGLQPAVQKLFALTRTDALFEVAPDRASALSG